MIWKKGLLGLLLATAAFDASAQPRDSRLMISEPVQGYAYYNRSGADLLEHDTEFRDCLLSTNARPNDSAPSPGLAFYVIWGGVLQAVGASAVENCMIAKGWRVFQLPEDEGRMFSRLSDADFLFRFTDMVGASSPPGVMARAWANQAARPATYHTPSRPRPPSRDQLSARAFALRGFEFTLRTADEATGPLFTYIRGKALERLEAPAPGNGIVIVRALGNRNIAFARTADTGGSTAFRLSGNRQGVWQAFEVPAGRWRITSTGWVNHCLGSPAFDISAGELVYAGTFDLEGQALGPALSLQDVPGLPGAAPRETLRAATYTNGTTGACNLGNGIYPLEIPGAPFEPGYRLASLAAGGTPAE